MRSLRAAVIAAGLSLAAAPAAAQLDPNFVPTLRTTFEKCTLVAWEDMSFDPFQAGRNTICSTLTVTTGRSSVTGMWGASADFFYTVAGYHPPSVTHAAWASGVFFRPIGPEAPSDLLLGSFNYHVPMRLGTTVYNPYLTADSRPTEAYGMSYSVIANSQGGPSYFDPITGFQITQVTAIPEPATVALLGGGLLVLGGLGAVRRHRQV